MVDFNVDIYSYTNNYFSAEIVGQGLNGTYDTVHLYVESFEDNNIVRVDEYIGRKAEQAYWHEEFDFSEQGLEKAIKKFNSVVTSSDRIKLDDIKKEIYKEGKFELFPSVEFDYDDHSGVFFAYVKGSDLSIAYAPKEEEDLSGWSIGDDGNIIVWDSWEEKSDDEIFESIKEFEKQLKKYFDSSDVKIIMKDFHEKVGM